MLGPLVIKSSLVFLILSFVIAFLYFWVSSSLSKETKKELLNQVESIIITFIISIYIGKMVFHIDILLSDPVAILAYPSNSNAFYIATLLTIIYSFIKMKTKTLEGVLYAFLQVFISASFVFEFFFLVLGDNGNILYFVILVLLLVTAILLQDKLTPVTISSFTIITWSLGQLVVVSLYGQASIFQFTISPWYFFVSLLIGFLVLILKKMGRIS